MTRIGWCPGVRTVTDMLAMYPGTQAVRIFAGAGKGLPAWDGPVLGPIPPNTLVHVSFKTWDVPAVERWLMAMPTGRAPMVLTYAHEPEQGTTAGDPTPEQFQARWAELVAALADHPRRPDVLLAPVYTRFWWQAHPGDLRWLLPTLGLDAIGWDIYNNGATYRTPDDLLTIPRQIAQRTGLPYLIAELGAIRLSADRDGSGRQAWMRNMVAAADADGAWCACWFHKDEWDLSGPGSVPEQQTWRDIIEQEAPVTRLPMIDRQESTPNKYDWRREVRGLVLHIAEGSYEGTIAWQKNPDSNVSSEFVIGRATGEWAQMMPLTCSGWTQRSGNGYWVASENAGYVADGLSDWQVEANARLLAELHTRYGVPLQVTETPATRGLGHHSMGAENGYDWGHPDCPGSKVRSRKAEIVTRAKAIIEGDDMTPDELLNTTVTNQATGKPVSIRALFEYQDTVEITTRNEIKAAVSAATATVQKQVATLGTSLTAAITALAAKDTVDEQALAAALAPGVAAAVVAQLPAGDTPVSREDLEAALRTVLGSVDNTAQ